MWSSPDALLPLRLQVFGTLVLLLFLWRVIWLIRAKRLSLTDSLSWFVSTLLALLLTIFPQTLAYIARALRIEVPVNALFACAFVYVSFNLLSNTLALSALSAKLRRVNQHCALLEAELSAHRRQAPP